MRGLLARSGGGGYGYQRATARTFGAERRRTTGIRGPLRGLWHGAERGVSEGHCEDCLSPGHRVIHTLPYRADCKKYIMLSTEYPVKKRGVSSCGVRNKVGMSHTPAPTFIGGDISDLDVSYVFCHNKNMDKNAFRRIKIQVHQTRYPYVIILIAFLFAETISLEFIS